MKPMNNDYLVRNVKPDVILLRMRDNGPPFDPLAALRAQAVVDPEKNLGKR